MIFKNIDDKTTQIQTLENLLSKSTSYPQKKLIDADLKRLKSGYEAELENAYYLNFEIDKNKNVILLHDIRIEHEGRTAQFDHILISRFGIELLETKSSKGMMTINEDGSLTLKNGKYVKTYPNPLEQSRRHAIVLREYLGYKGLLTKRFAIFGGIEITSKVLINPKTTLTNKKLMDGFQRADSFISKRRKEIDSISFFKALSSVSKGYSIDKAKEIAKMLVDAHKPVEFDYANKFKIAKEKPIKEKSTINEPAKEPVIKPEPKVTICPRCNNGELVLRKTKSKKAKEKYENKEFLGCSNYPKCRYIESLDSRIVRG